jgi:hypothetical protein
MRPMKSAIVLVPAILLAGCVTPAPFTDARFDDGPFCSRWLAEHDRKLQLPEDHRRCVIAVASTYIATEENSAPPEQQLFADDVSRHRIGTQPVFAAGNRARLMAENSHEVIAAIRNRRWAVDGGDAWILYDGYLKTDPIKPAFYVAERFWIEHGLIKEILVADITLANKERGK